MFLRWWYEWVSSNLYDLSHGEMDSKEYWETQEWETVEEDKWSNGVPPDF